MTGVSGAIHGITVPKNNCIPSNSADDFIVFTPTTELGFWMAMRSLTKIFAIDESAIETYICTPLPTDL
ncbi:hypothetical protein [Nostoc sp.]|uniref:hypothetical protein n=1 Tax=Nostoc sp. TaxID=1180 RepID=UPI002FF8CA27